MECWNTDPVSQQEPNRTSWMIEALLYGTSTLQTSEDPRRDDKGSQRWDEQQNTVDHLHQYRSLCSVLSVTAAGRAVSRERTIQNCRQRRDHLWDTAILLLHNPNRRISPRRHTAGSDWYSNGFFDRIFRLGSFLRALGAGDDHATAVLEQSPHRTATCILSRSSHCSHYVPRERSIQSPSSWSYDYGLYNWVGTQRTSHSYFS